ncbi:Endomembrane-type CA-ATPase 4 isoform 1 [Hibiscus syriacus]|uniref:Endomembrane-type CA-ATPase 4 isoform 1 n=1 Tax=Hibiscus syriacus TaxID=106335 RepID=A0A6A2ZN10_HIBSY|nr:uncharacterized protein LOC120142346 [Hibiscus syriacus]KAE8692857.1 Endomembrane-type CA-ATPase 4 isoform 1 [Hibiscus syriacus]
MSSVCMSSCLTDARGPRVPYRANYVNLYKWPESDAEFVRSRSSRATVHGGYAGVVVDSVWCRQMYLRSYRFTRRETVAEKSLKWFGRVKEKTRKKRVQMRRIRRRKCLVWRKMKVALFRFFNRLLACSAAVDVAGQRPVFF